MEWQIRLAAFVAIFTAMSAWEVIDPRRPLRERRSVRWPANLGLLILGSAAVRLLVTGGAFAAAAYAAEHRVGVLHWLGAPTPLAWVATLVVLDLAVYFQHVTFHAVPGLWRIHRVHHADVDFDATTGIRFHPIEILLSLGLKAGVVLLLGAPPWAVVAFEIVLNASSVFNHGNVRIADPIDGWLRSIIVTPDMHRIHHSTRVIETNSNYGFSVSWWDRLLGTYRAEPELGHLGMEIGLSEYRNALGLGRLLRLPLDAAATGVDRVSPSELRSELSPPPPPLVLDVRCTEEFAGPLGHIEGAVSVPLADLEKRLDELGVHRNGRIVTV